MEGRQDYFNTRQFLHGVQVHRHAPAVILDADTAIAVQYHVNAVGVALDGLVDRVINDLLGQMIWTRGVGVHPRALAHRLEAGQDLNGIGVVLTH